jgi:two-component system, LytTR family, response regulator
MKCIIVDDEPLALDLLEDNLLRIPFVQNVARCKNAFEAIQAIQQFQPDLVFLDIQMPALDGLSFVKSLPNPPMVIFVTAHKQYTLESYDLNALDYLVKPVSFERFLKACTKANEWYQLRQRVSEAGFLDVQEKSKPEFMMVHIDYSLVRVNFKDILFVEGLKDYVKIFLTEATRPLVTRMNLKAIEEQLPTQEFHRIHRSYIVALNKIEALRKGSVAIAGQELPVGESFRERLNQYFNIK